MMSGKEILQCWSRGREYCVSRLSDLRNCPGFSGTWRSLFADPYASPRPPVLPMYRYVITCWPQMRNSYHFRYWIWGDHLVIPSLIMLVLVSQFLKVRRKINIPNRKMVKSLTLTKFVLSVKLIQMVRLHTGMHLQRPNKC